METNIFNKELYLDPFGMFAEWRNSDNLPYDASTNTFALSRYNDIHFALRSPHLFTSSFGGRANSIPQPFMVDVDDPEHRIQRAIVEKSLTPSSVGKHYSYLQSVLDTCIGDAAGAGEIDVVTNIAQTLPVNFVGSMLGIPSNDFPLLRHWGEAMVEGADGWENVTDETVAAVIHWFEYFDDLYRSGFWDEGDDLVHLLVSAHRGGVITYEEARGNALAILIGGNETAKYLLSGVLHLYASDPTVFNKFLVDSPSRDAITNEIFRYISPVVSSARRATKDVLVGDEVIPSGSQVMLFLLSGNRDARKFSAPDHFAPFSNSQQHLSLGFGPHYCIGASLAKIQIQCLLDYMISHNVDIEISREALPGYKYSTFLRGIRHMTASITINR